MDIVRVFCKIKAARRVHNITEEDFPILLFVDKEEGIGAWVWISRPLRALRESGEPVVIDSTGVKAHRAGSCIEGKYGERRYRKIHLSVNAGTAEIIDEEMARRMIEVSIRAGDVSRVIGHKAQEPSKAAVKSLL